MRIDLGKIHNSQSAEKTRAQDAPKTSANSFDIMLKRAQSGSLNPMREVEDSGSDTASPFDLLRIGSDTDAEITRKYDVRNMSGAEYSSMLKELFAAGSLTFDEIGSVYSAANFYWGSFDPDSAVGVPFSEDPVKKDLVECVREKMSSLDVLLTADPENGEEISRHKNILSSMLSSFDRISDGVF